MSDQVEIETGDPVAELRAAVAAAAAALRGDEPGGEVPGLERPPQPDFGDYSTNAAMLLAPALGGSPRDAAERLAGELKERLGDRLERVEVAGPGFLNLTMTDLWYHGAVAALAAKGDEVSRPAVPVQPERILIEFVSANPTGPLTAASGRHAAYGDAVARLLENAGHTVDREYYLNDVGGQTDRFAASVAARMSGGGLPEDGYEGAYVTELADKLSSESIDPGDMDAVSRRAVALMTESIQGTMERFGVRFDGWASERAIHDEGKLDQILADLADAGHTYESDGARWLRTSAFGDDKDRVLVRSEGAPTYYLSDIAYHRHKAERGYDRLLNVLGADHHGYVSRLKAAMQALGFGADVLEIQIIQLVHIVEAGERAQMSKRKGEFVTLDELIGDIGADSARYFMLARSHETAVDLDLDLARKTESDNPVYYAQYAHARNARILDKAGADAAARAQAAAAAGGGAAFEPAERELIKRLCELPAEAAEAAERRAPQKLCAYASALASDYNAFYRDCQVLGAGDPFEGARLGLCLLTKRSLASSLGLLGISAPERM